MMLESLKPKNLNQELNKEVKQIHFFVHKYLTIYIYKLCIKKPRHLLKSYIFASSLCVMCVCHHKCMCVSLCILYFMYLYEEVIKNNVQGKCVCTWILDYVILLNFLKLARQKLWLILLTFSCRCQRNWYLPNERFDER